MKKWQQDFLLCVLRLCTSKGVRESEIKSWEVKNKWQQYIVHCVICVRGLAKTAMAKWQRYSTLCTFVAKESENDVAFVV